MIGRPVRVTDRATGTSADLLPPRAATRATVVPLDDGGLEVVVDGWRFVMDLEDAARADLRARATRSTDAAGPDGPLDVRAIIPGRVLAVAVAPGQAVTAGTRLLSLEAMKMENDVRAPRDGIVEDLAVAPGETVELGDVLVRLR